MSKSQKKTPTSKNGEPVIVSVCRNRRASHEYELHDRLECGIVLVGTEVKSLRDGHASLEDAFARIENDEMWLYSFDIPEYKMGNRLNHEPKRTRKLLMRRAEIKKFAVKATVKGFTLIPLSVYFKDGRAKVEIAIAKGKQFQDKRQSLKNAEAKREMDRAMSQARRRNN